MIDLDLTDEQRVLEQSVREWGAREMAPRIHELDRAHRFDPNILPRRAAGLRARGEGSRVTKERTEE